MHQSFIFLFAALSMLLLAAPFLFASGPIPETLVPRVIVPTVNEPITPGKFKPTWESLAQYEVPEWFRDAKFGIWAHWGPQCQPESGDWYARNLYIEGHPHNRFQIEHFGHPSEAGFKDVIQSWKAERWDPEKLVALYKRAGAKYFFAMANHHDNLDLYDSKYQPWNSLAVGPRKDVMAGWAKAARNHGLRLGVSVHAAHAWTWYELSQAADKKGSLAGKPYDGKLTAGDGKGTWWEGLDPRDLYEQNHTPSVGFDDPNSIHHQWSFEGGASTPDAEYCEKFYNRTVDLIHKYKPDVIYFDDNALPLWPVSDAGLKIAAEFYNFNMLTHGERLEAVLLGKKLTEGQRKCIAWDIERGASNRIEPIAWQTDTCIGDWHYNRSVYNNDQYKTAKSVVHTLADVVSKNGNLLLNVPVRGDGTIDEKEIAIVEGIAAWMEPNGECIFGTRPWKVFGEGPTAEGPQLEASGMNEEHQKPHNAADIRFTAKGDAVYAIILGVPTGDISIKSLGTAANLLDAKINSVTMLGSAESLQWSQTAGALTIKRPKSQTSATSLVVKIVV